MTAHGPRVASIERIPSSFERTMNFLVDEASAISRAFSFLPRLDGCPISRHSLVAFPCFLSSISTEKSLFCQPI